jgi:hypothetical protein
MARIGFTRALVGGRCLTPQRKEVLGRRCWKLVEKPPARAALRNESGSGALTALVKRQIRSCVASAYRWRGSCVVVVYNPTAFVLSVPTHECYSYLHMVDRSGSSSHALPIRRAEWMNGPLTKDANAIGHMMAAPSMTNHSSAGHAPSLRPPPSTPKQPPRGAEDLSAGRIWGHVPSALLQICCHVRRNTCEPCPTSGRVDPSVARRHQNRSVADLNNSFTKW